MAFCTKCGAEVDQAAPYCSRCGAQASETLVRRFQVHTEGASLLGLYLVMFLLSILTLGIYSFWGRTNIRRYVAGTIEFEGDRFAYHGTGGELFRGFLKAVGVLILLYLQVFLWVLVAGRTAGSILGILVLYIAVLCLIPYALVGTWRYRLSRTSWRGIRFAFRGTAGDLFPIYLKGALLTLVTLGFYSPFFMNNLRRFLFRHAWYGNARFDYDGEGRDLFGDYLIGALAAIPTLGLTMIWFYTRRFNYYWSRTSFVGARFQAGMTFGGLFGLMITNVLLVIFTLGIAIPWAQVRAMRYIASNITLHGALDLAAIERRAAAATATGDEISTMLETDAGDVGLGL